MSRNNAVHKNIAIVSIFVFIAFFGLILRVLSLNYNYAHQLPLLAQAYAIETFIFGLNSLLVFSSTLLLFIVFKQKSDRLSTCIATSFILLSINSIYLYHTRSPEIKDLKYGVMTLQSDAMSCAAASLSNISTYYQMPISEQDAATAIKTTVQGSSPAQIVLGARQLGFHAEIFHNTKIKDLRYPSMLFVDAPLGREKHALVIMKKIDNFYINNLGLFYEVWDPEKGPVYWSKELLQSRWHGNGVYIKPK
ncbi:cysteine peptidase family C39 domain-containing protein [Lentisphaera profundi]|uniref:Cysteine peptidase family C39 domain-containing protein n=1 Tax=Lentisphaera profundi TaxID=1658616 RepID=A0ABY7VVQ2_9BACT|nr:cysteine peptidase family C39 domain-containing protein [Lentisphaera profundi]WDE97792.1 cysteine peptidase family C39 domain-containing protein [Lentisphaera profundi]